DLADEGAFVVSSSERDGTGDQDPTIHMSIRVPVEQFDETMNRLAAMAVTIRQRNETAQDVTEEYVDLQGRLKAMEIARDRLLDIMENSENTEDLLEAEQQLTKREVDIEGIKGRMQYLSGAASLSRIKIDLSPHILSQPIDSSWRPAEEARRSLDILVNSFQNFISGLIRFGISGLPWLVFYGWIVYAVYRFVKKRGLLVFDDPKETPSKKE
ncbi:MAG: DUF4349 domain-containing protein, partial [Anaerolineae bacterium]|nr:DUF4349 domain-containing protein [Anaerolineae bacterium]